MKKGYYIHFDARTVPGIDKKIEMQIKEFNKHFDIVEINVKSKKRSLLERIVGLFPTASISREYEEVLSKLIDPDFIYVRRTTCDRKYLNFFKTIKKLYPNCKIIIEVFTYPYDRDDFAKWNAWPFFIKEVLFRGKLKKCVDRFVTYSHDDSIFGVETIRTINGFDIDSVKAVTGEYTDDSFRMIGVAHMQRHHGYERIIRGMRTYYESNNHSYKVFLTLVGDGPEKENYRKLVNEYNLTSYITFLPSVYGDELEREYENADMALTSFGLYKLNILERASVLKSRECLAKGLPMVSGCLIDVIDDDYPYAFFAPNDNSDVDIFALVEFYKKLKALGSKEDNAKIIRQFAYKCVSMEKAMDPVISFLENTI